MNPCPPSTTDARPDPAQQATIAALREQTIGRLFLQAYRRFTTLAIGKLRERGYAGLSLTQAILLVNIDADGTRIVTLAERAGIAKQSMGQVVADLEQKGYIARSADPRDRRAVRITLTEAGWAYLVDTAEVRREIEADCAAVLGTTQLRTLYASLKTLLSDTASVD